MPPTEEMIRVAARALSRIRLESFSVLPTLIRPLEQATLSWKVAAENGEEVRLQVRGGGLAFEVPFQGSRTVLPNVTTSYNLVALRPPLKRGLASVTVSVDTSACYSLAIDEVEVRARFHSKVDELLASKPELRRRRDELVEIDASGIRFAVRLKAVIENWANPDIDIDGLVKLRAENGEARYTLTKYSFDIDFPWYADIVHATILPVWLVLAIREGNKEQEARGYIEDAIEELLGELTATIRNAGYTLITLNTAPDQVNYMICPS